ncbi:MAG: hypothetical protein H7836_10010 [Magnetococcus sp. YQC-3]
MAESTPSTPDFQNELDQLTVLQRADVTDLSAKEHAGVQAELLAGFDPVASPADVHLRRESTLGGLQVGGESGHGGDSLALSPVVLPDDARVTAGVDDRRDGVEHVPSGRMETAQESVRDWEAVTPRQDEEGVVAGRSQMEAGGTDVVGRGGGVPTDSVGVTPAVTTAPAKRRATNTASCRYQANRC